MEDALPCCQWLRRWLQKPIVLFSLGPSSVRMIQPPICSYNSHLAARNPEFLKAALQYTKDVFITAEIMRLTPKLLAPYSPNFVALLAIN